MHILLYASTPNRCTGKSLAVLQSSTLCSALRVFYCSLLADFPTDFSYTVLNFHCFFFFQARVIFSIGRLEYLKIKLMFWFSYPPVLSGEHFSLPITWVVCPSPKVHHVQKLPEREKILSWKGHVFFSMKKSSLGRQHVDRWDCRKCLARVSCSRWPRNKVATSYLVLPAQDLTPCMQLCAHLQIISTLCCNENYGISDL